MLLVRTNDHVPALVDVEESRTPSFDVVERAGFLDAPRARRVGRAFNCLSRHGGKIMARNELRVPDLLSPSIPLAHVHIALVQPARHAAPELDATGNEPEPRPIRRTRHRLSLEPCFGVANARLEITCPRDRAALLRRPCANLAAALPAREIRVGLLDAHRARHAFHADLAHQRLPVKAHRRLRVREKLASLAALEVGVEDESEFIRALE